ncbi:hypothetical protein BU26DRAFT_470142 [Trematosphaeria pertusa]|uniref:Cora-domain-containing protein n=1 Tax=Trematosphaeria pertusa TaxID=390896 RepID=A0A6A6HTM6_9PLEO|nr:uncharacterized protein BU26DRAFT_470142 [Trematosphaeria pertusa]KAF2240883.1 hypothetical protein BU26DRAFT_470142 [Trematosphaeria pertusa]
MAFLHTRSQSDPPPIMVEDTATGAEPQLSPSPTTRPEKSKTFSTVDERPKPKQNDSFTGAYLRDRRQSTWEKGHRRHRSPNIGWHEKWTKDSWKKGRVLLVDYVAKEHSGEGRRKIVAQEFSDVDSLKRYYKNEALSQQAALRVIHVQNASWATQFFLQKFNIDATDDLVGTNFGRWAKYEKPQKRGGKPVLNGKTFRATRDPWRGISRAAFGLDYLRHYEKHKCQDSTNGMKMMELNHYDALDQPTYGFDVYVQRLSVYVQLDDGEAGELDDPDIRNPYDEDQYQEFQRLKRQYASIDANGQEQYLPEHYIPKLQTLDNGSTIIVFENSQSGSVQDTLIGARQEIEARWRRLTFYLPKEEVKNDERLATECMDLVLRDIFKALAFNWEKYINICETHVGILEDKIYDHPADESRAPELWTNSSLWLKVERLMYLHTDVIKEMRNHLHDLADDLAGDRPWLGSAAEEMDKLTTQFEEGVVKPTTNLSDLMYKSVGIRDARHSLQLGLSMWRLSWITFIFLPLTFVCGFFGMNVDTFQNEPSIKWWFVATVPLFVVVIIGWYGIKHSLASQRQDPLRRGVYENLYYDLASKHPSLWSRRGPRPGIIPVGWWAGVKWRLLTKWFDAERTILAKGYDPGDEELGVWSRVKQSLVRRWLANITVMPQTTGASSEPDLEAARKEGDVGAVQELVHLATPIALADGDPTAASRLRKRTPLERLRSLSPTRSEGDRPNSAVSGRSSADAASGIMVEEKSEDERSGDEGGEETRARESTFAERLNVPLYPGGAGIVAGGL